ncbi:MAG: hypothetical protein GQ545_02200 [Candidatus Aminicenantes bacterium]|nr:hypothetical protein [Candidatus Aminicenantes bacterium]
MRKKIPGQFPAAPGRPSDIDTYLKSVDDIYVTDAYHSLSIEGYRISPELIERVRSGEWNPDGYDDDREYRNALVARGFPWTVIPLEKRDDYMAALESASVRQDIAPFAMFLGRFVSDNLGVMAS